MSMCPATRSWTKELHQVPHSLLDKFAAGQLVDLALILYVDDRLTVYQTLGALLVNHVFSFKQHIQLFSPQSVQSPADLLQCALQAEARLLW